MLSHDGILAESIDILLHPNTPHPRTIKALPQNKIIASKTDK